MANPALGTKRICAGCSAKFYDLGKDPIICPTCDTLYVIPKAPPPRGGRSSYAPRSVYDPKAQTSHSVGTLKEAEAPGVADDAEEKEDAGDEAEVAGIEDVEEGDGAPDAGGVPMLEELDEK